MDTPTIIFNTNKESIISFMASLAKEYRKYCPQGNPSMIETALRILDLVKSKKKKGTTPITADEWKTFCLYALYIDDTKIIPKTGSFGALSELRKKIT